MYIDRQTQRKRDINITLSVFRLTQREVDRHYHSQRQIDRETLSCLHIDRHYHVFKQIDREREVDRHSKRQIDRHYYNYNQIDTKMGRQTMREIDRLTLSCQQIKRHRERQIDIVRDRQIETHYYNYSQIDTEIGRQTLRQIDRQREREIDRQTHTHTQRERQIDITRDRQTERERDRETLPCILRCTKPLIFDGFVWPLPHFFLWSCGPYLQIFRQFHPWEPIYTVKNISKNPILERFRDFSVNNRHSDIPDIVS